jgi:YidC/Oxa1 family membrane protein insertase
MRRNEADMRFAVRFAALFVALLVMCGPMAGAQDKPFGEAFEKADKLVGQSDAAPALDELKRIYEANRDSNPPLSVEASRRRIALLERLSRRSEVFGEYTTVVNDFKGRNPEIAAQALLEAGRFLRERFGVTPDEKRHGASQAWKTWKTLRDEYAGTRAAQTLASEKLIESIEEQIRTTNSADWKYRIIDGMVALTGRNPSYSYALALILIALIVKALTFPLTLKQYASMREMQKIQPLMKELQAKYKGPELNTKMMELYKEHGVNPLAGCFPALVQMPFLYMVFVAIQLYEVALSQAGFLWIGSPLAKQYPNFIGGSLSQSDVPILVLYSVSMYITMRMTPSPDPAQAQQQRTMAWMMSGFFFWMFMTQKWGSGFVLYWLVQNILNIWQQYEYIYKPNKAKMAAAAGGGGTVEVSVPASPSTQRNGSGKAAEPAGSQPRVRPRKRK